MQVTIVKAKSQYPATFHRASRPAGRLRLPENAVLPLRDFQVNLRRRAMDFLRRTRPSTLPDTKPGALTSDGQSQ